MGFQEECHRERELAEINGTTSLDVMRVGLGLGFDRDGKPLTDAHGLIRRVMRMATSVYGGCFVVKGWGEWSDGDKVIEEPGAVLTVYGTITLGGAVEFARIAGQVLDQKAVMLEYNGRAEEVQC
jgi:hypothetical protein